MPSRLLREGILDSEAVNNLTPGAEVFYRRLMSIVDDFGRFDGRPAVLRARLYSLKLDTVREADVSGWLRECAAGGLVQLYTVAGKPYLLFDKLGQPRAKESKYPPPSAADTPTRADVNGCAQPNACAPYSYSDSVTYSGSDSFSCSEVAKPPSEPEPATPPPTTAVALIADTEPPVLTLPCTGTGSKAFPLSQSKVDEWADAYPGIDVLSEVRKARQWLIDNPKRAKTASGMLRFLGSWLSRAQDSARVPTARPGLFDRGAAHESRMAAQIAEALQSP